jgi:hypothetical protein
MVLQTSGAGRTNPLAPSCHLLASLAPGLKFEQQIVVREEGKEGKTSVALFAMRFDKVVVIPLQHVVALPMHYVVATVKSAKKAKR